MPHFFVPPEAIRGERFVLGGAESRHLATVLRKRPGDEILLFDGADRSYRGRLESVSPARVEGRIIAPGPRLDLPYALRLFQGLPKGDKLDWILEKAAELGAAEIVPVITERSVPKIPADRLPGRVERWEKIVLAAAKQCGRASVPRVGAPLDLAAALRLCGDDSLTLLPWEGEETKTLREALRPQHLPHGKPLAVNVLVGPEGGFSPREVEEARRAGAVPVTLGPLILRTETAGLFVASALMYEWGSSSSKA